MTALAFVASGTAAVSASPWPPATATCRLPPPPLFHYLPFTALDPQQPGPFGADFARFGSEGIEVALEAGEEVRPCRQPVRAHDGSAAVVDEKDLPRVVRRGVPRAAGVPPV